MIVTNNELTIGVILSADSQPANVLMKWRTFMATGELFATGRADTFAKVNTIDATLRWAPLDFTN